MSAFRTLDNTGSLYVISTAVSIRLGTLTNIRMHCQCKKKSLFGSRNLQNIRNTNIRKTTSVGTKVYFPIQQKHFRSTNYIKW
jgi:hypothetical protein